MRKVICPVKCETWTAGDRRPRFRGFCEIAYENERLSIHGVIGPMKSGNCRGSAGQCTDSIRKGDPIIEEGWTREMVDKFCDIWDRWHLNDMHPACEHQRELGWEEQAREPMFKYHFHLKAEPEKMKRQAEKEAVEHLKKGEPFTPDSEQIFYARLPQFLTQYDPLNDEQAEYYEAYKSGSVYEKPEKTSRGWVRFDEDERGILCKPCPVCGYKYGTAWKHEPVPQDVIDWLFSLPDTPVRPAWV